MNKNTGKHQHKWQLASTQFQYPETGYTATSMAIEYAYLLCQCGRVRKVKVESV